MQGFPARKYIHLKENFIENKFCSYKIFAKFFLRNYRMNEKIHNFSINLHVLDWTTQAQLASFTFMALYSRRLWYRTCWRKRKHTKYSSTVAKRKQQICYLVSTCRKSLIGSRKRQMPVFTFEVIIRHHR